MIQNQVKDAAAKLVTGIHRAVFTASGGRVGGRVMRMPVVMLTTTGRKSGKRRTTMLTSPVQEGENVVLVASYMVLITHSLKVEWFIVVMACLASIGDSLRRLSKVNNVLQKANAAAGRIFEVPHRDFVSFSSRKTSLIISNGENGEEHFAIVPLLTITSAMARA